MKRFLIPAFFVIDVADNQNVSVAQEIAAHMQSAANELSFGNNEGEHCLLLDEGINDREVPIVPEETELPHTFNWQPPQLDINPVTRFRLGAAFREATKQ